MEKMEGNPMFELSKSQYEILALETESYKDETINVQAAAVFLDEQYPQSVIEQAVNLIIEHEQALRLKIVSTDEGFWQQELPYTFTPIAFQTIKGLQGDDFYNYLCEQAKIEIGYKSYPLFRIFVCAGEAESAIVVVGHHIVFDFWSFLMIGHQMVSLCKQLSNGETPKLVHHVFTQSCAKERELLRSDRYRRDLAYWEEKFSSPPPLCRLMPNKLVSDVPYGKRIEIMLEDDFTARLMQFCAEQDVSPSAMFQTAIVMWLYHKNPETCRVDFGQMTLGRNSIDEKQMLGNFAVENIICVAVNKELTVSALIKNVQLCTMESIYHGLLLHDDVLHIAQKKNSKINSVRDIEFGYVPECNMFDFEPEMAWLTEEEPETSVEYLVYQSKCHGISVFFHYRTSVFEENEAQEAFDGILNMLGSAIQNPDNLLGNFL